jgi:hypothetical protein
MMLLDGQYVDGSPEAHLFRWFASGGAIGLLIAFALAILIGHVSVPLSVVLWLWPTSMAALVDPTSLGLFTYGGNFLVYGLIAVAFGSLIAWLRGSLRRRSATAPTRS